MAVDDGVSVVKRNLTEEGAQHGRRANESAGNKSLSVTDTMKGFAQSVFDKVSKVVGSLTRDPVTHRVQAVSRPEDMARVVKSDSREGIKNAAIGRKFDGPGGR